MTKKKDGTDRVALTYAEKRKVEDAIRSHIEEGLPKFRDNVDLAESLSQALGMKVTVGHLQGLFSQLDDLDRTDICHRAPAGSGNGRRPINVLRDELSALSARVRKLEAFVNDLKD